MYIIDIMLCVYVCMCLWRRKVWGRGGKLVMFTTMYATDRSDERNGADMKHNEASKTVS